MAPLDSVAGGKSGSALAKRERVRRALACAEVDRPPYSFWSHFPGIDRDPAALVAHTLRFAAALEVDFVKAMSNGMYCVEDWGVVINDSDIADGGVARIVSTPIAAPSDWRCITALRPTAPALSRELRHLAALADALGGQTPLLATVFSPLTVAHKLAGDALPRDVRDAPALVLAALEQIAHTTAAFARQALAVGCAGVYFAIQDADPAVFDDATYAVFGEPFDRMVLEAAGHGWFNVVHMHGPRILFDRLKTYPVTALNWHIGEASPSLAAYRAGGGARPVVGGLRRGALTRGDMAAVREDLAAVGTARGILLAPGCVIRHPLHIGFLQHVASLIARNAMLVQGTTS